MTAPRRDRRRFRWLRIFKGIAVFVGFVFLLGVGFLLWAFERGHALRWTRAEVLRALHDQCALDARIGEMSIGLFPPTLEMSQVELAHLDGRALIAVEESIVTLQVLPLFARRLELDRVFVLGPRATVELDQGKIRDLPPCLEPTADADTISPVVFGIRELAVERGRFRLRIHAEPRVDAELEGIGVTLRPGLEGGGSDLAIGVDDGVLVRGGQARPLHRFRFFGHIEGLLTAPRAIVVEQIDVALASVRVEGSGSVDLLGPVFEAKISGAAPLSAIHDFVDGAPETEGEVKLVASLSGTLSAPRASGRLELANGRVDTYRLADHVAAEFIADRAGAELGLLDIKLGDGRVKARARIAFDEHLTVHADTDGENVSLGRILDNVGVSRPWVDLRGYGKGSFEGTLLDPFILRGAFDYQIEDLAVFDRPFDAPEARGPHGRSWPSDPRHLYLRPPRPIHATGLWSWEESGLTIEDATVESGDTRGNASARISFSTKGGADIRGTLHSFDFADIGPIAGLHLGGRGSVRGWIGGPLDLLTAKGSLELDGVEVEGIPFGRAKAQLDWRDDTVLDFTGVEALLDRTRYSGALRVDVRGEVPFHIEGTLDDGRVQDLFIPFGLVAADWGAPTGRVKGRYRLDGPIKQLSGPVQLELWEASLVGERFERGQVVGRFERGVIVLEDFELEKHGGLLAGRGRLDPLKGTLRAHAKSRELSLQHVDLLAASTPKLDGRLELAAVIAGPFRALTGTVTARLEGLHAGSMELPAGRLVGKIYGAKMAVQGSVLGAALALDGELGLKTGLPYRANLRLAEFDVPRLVGSLGERPTLRGRAEGQAKLRGSLVDWRRSSGEILLEKAEVDSGSLKIETQGPSELTLDRGVLETRRILLAGPKSRLVAEGRLGAELVDLKVEGKVDLALAELLSPNIERVGGLLSLDSAVQGSWGRVNLVGTGKVEGGLLQLRGIDGRVSGFDADLTFSQSTVLVERGEGRWAEGRVGLTGNLLLDGVRLKSFALELELEGVRPRFSYPLVDLTGTLSGLLLLEGTTSRFALRGELDALRARVQPKFDLTKLVGQSANLKVYDPGQEIMDLDVGVHLKEPARVKNDALDLEVNGDVRVTGTNQRFGFLGGTTFVSGGRVSFLGRTYQISAGLIEFLDRFVFAPRYDLTLLTDACAARIRVNLVGTLDQVSTSYASNPEMDEANVLSCLFRGVRVQEQDDLAKFASGALWKLTGLDREVKKVLPIDEIDVTTEYSSQSRGYEPRILLAKELSLFGGPARLEYSRSLLKNEDQRVALGYRITPKLTLQGNWVAEQTVQTVVGDLGLDLKYRLEW